MPPTNIECQAYDPQLHLIKETDLAYYEYDHFSNVEEIGVGEFGKIYRAKSGSPEHYVALKSFNFNDDIVKEIVNEVTQNI